jgi:uncharacterized membrane protein/protein-disulfide isomerase
MTGLIILALALSAYLSWHYLAGGTMIGCGGGSPCDEVLNSRWSTIGGFLPVSGLAMGAYLAMLVAGFFIGPAMEAPVRRLAWGAMLVLAGSVAGSAVWFTILQKWVIGAFCLYCMTAHITGLLLAVLIIWRATMAWKSSDFVRLRNSFPIKSDGSDKSDSSDTDRKELCNRNRLMIISPVLVGLVMAGILAACQVVITPPAVYHSGESQNKLPSIDLHAVPMIGSPDANYVVNVLFDYKCPHCQNLHFMLNEAVRRYGGKLAFALCPAPLNSKCNPYIPRDVDVYKDSCELAKVGMAVWLANREAFSAFDNWMYSFESGDRWQPRSLDDARAKAVELVGKAKFNTALADPWIDQYIATCVKIYGQTLQSGKGGVPKMVYNSRWVIPELYSADDLVWILQNSLGVPVP